MKILLINHYAGSLDMGMEFRPYYMSKEWVKLGHNVDIIAADFSHLRVKNPDITRNFETHIIDGISYHWIKTLKYNGNNIKRLLTMFQFVVKILIRAKKIAHEFQPDIIINSSTYPLDTFVGQRIKKYCGKQTKLIHEVHDMWPISPMEINGMSKHHPFIRLMQISENSFCKKADMIVSLLPAAKEYFIEHGMLADKFVHIPNGVYINDWNIKEVLPKQHKEAIAKMKKEERFIICYFGSLNITYAIQYIIEAVKLYESKCFSDVKVGLILIGEGNYKNELIQLSKDSINKSIVFLPRVAKRIVPALLNQVDSTYIGICRNKLTRFGICMNKLFDAMMAGKPILYASDAPNDYIKEYNCGVSVEPENSEFLTVAIHKLVNMSMQEKMDLGNNGKKAILNNFNYSVLAQKFMDNMEKLHL